MNTRSPGRAAVGAAIIVLTCVCSLVGVGGCEDRQKLLEAYAKQAAVNRTTATGGLIGAFKAGQITVDEAITLAADKLEAGEDAVNFAGAVLDMVLAVEAQLPQKGEFEIFWRRVGRLAFWAANTAYVKGRTEEAAALVMAGPKRWQNEAYWQRYGDHDALVAILLDERGQRAEAIRRLDSRADLSPEAQEVLDRLRRKK